jgi:hypothetical protein
MAVQLTVYDPDETITFEVGVANVQNVVVTFSFANVVHVKIYYTDGRLLQYYQVPCKLLNPAP